MRKFFAQYDLWLRLERRLACRGAAAAAPPADASGASAGAAILRVPHRRRTAAILTRESARAHTSRTRSPRFNEGAETILAFRLRAALPLARRRRYARSGHERFRRGRGAARAGFRATRSLARMGKSARPSPADRYAARALASSKPPQAASLCSPHLVSSGTTFIQEARPLRASRPKRNHQRRRASNQGGSPCHTMQR
jgi:hypothetical protein